MTGIVRARPHVALCFRRLAPHAVSTARLVTRCGSLKGQGQPDGPATVAPPRRRTPASPRCPVN